LKWQKSWAFAVCYGSGLCNYWLKTVGFRTSGSTIESKKLCVCNRCDFSIIIYPWTKIINNNFLVSLFVFCSERIEKIKDIRANVLECVVLLVRHMQIYEIPISNKFSQTSYDYIRSIDLKQDFEYTSVSCSNFKLMQCCWKVSILKYNIM